jgi:hypothetical protein
MDEHETADDAPSTAARQVFWLLRIGFTAAPILFGVDKFFNWTVHWPDYLAGWIDHIVPGTAQDFMYAVGAIEIVAGLAVAAVPRLGAPLVAAWLGGIVVNLLTVDPPEYYDIALRDFGLMLGALTLARLAWAVPAGQAAYVRALARPRPATATASGSASSGSRAVVVTRIPGALRKR